MVWMWGSENALPATSARAHGGRVDRLSPMAAQVLRVAQEHPGACIQFIADQLRCGHSRVAYHAATLERKNVLRKERDGIFVRNYACTGGGPQAWERLLPHLRHPKRRVLIEHLVAEPRREWNMHQLATRAGLVYTSMLTSMRVLRDQGFIQVEQRRRSGRYMIRATAHLVACFRQCPESVGNSLLEEQAPVQGASRSSDPS